MKKTFIYLIALLPLIFADQFSKIWLIKYLSNITTHEVELLPFFKLVSVWNQGMSFGLFGHHTYSNLAFIICNSLIVLYLLYQINILQDRTSRFSLLLIVGGALGNLIDRVIHGAVFDFILLHCGAYSFPAFNLADAYISIGVFIYLAYHLVGKSDEYTNQ